jgi:hypothetical protein
MVAALWDRIPSHLDAPERTAPNYRHREAPERSEGIVAISSSYAGARAFAAAPASSPPQPETARTAARTA